jgi:hypothetical protein
LDPFCHVALVRLGLPVEDEARALVADLGGALYDQRLKLATGVPALILTTRDVAKARTIAMRAQQRGHGVFLCSSDDVVAPLPIIEFELGPDAFISLETGHRLPWPDIHALVRTTYRSSAETKTAVTKRELSPVRAIATGGLLMSKKVTTTQTTHSTEMEAALYIFGPPRTAPLLLRQRQARYAGLGAALTTSSATNFELTLTELRGRAPQAVFDDRLVSRKQTDLDLLAHIVARMPR